MFGSENGGSRLLAALHSNDFKLIEPHLQSLHLAAGQVLHEAGSLVEHAFFPRGSALVSFLVLMPDGDGVESALIGREGAVGGIVSQGHMPAYARCCVLLGGEGGATPEGDGRAGAEKGRARGGLVIVQNPATAVVGAGSSPGAAVSVVAAATVLHLSEIAPFVSRLGDLELA